MQIYIRIQSISKQIARMLATKKGRKHTARMKEKGSKLESKQNQRMKARRKNASMQNARILTKKE